MKKEPTKNSETAAETAHRLALEARTRQIAEVIKQMMPPGTAFMLVSAEHGRGGATAYVSTLKREDSVRLLSELLDGWKYRDGLTVEPSPATATFLREQVYALRAIHPRKLLQTMREAVESAERVGLAMDDAADESHAKELVTQAMSCATMGLALLQSFQEFAYRKAREEGKPA